MGLNTPTLKSAIEAALKHLDEQMQQDKIDALIDAALTADQKTRDDFSHFSKEKMDEFVLAHIKAPLYAKLAGDLAAAIENYVRSGEVVGVATESPLETTIHLDQVSQNEVKIVATISGHQTNTVNIK